MKSKIFISSPYTLGDVAQNLRIQHDVFNNLFTLGYMPFMPLLAHYQHMIHPLEYDQWIEYDYSWLETCDILLRLPGESKGADLEVTYANKIGIPVAYSIEEVKILLSRIK